MTFSRKALPVVLVALALSFASRPAMADTIDIVLGIGNPAISGFAGPYANVNVNLTSSTTATITFTSETVNGNIYLLGDGGSVGVNVNAGSWTIGSISGSNAGTGFTPGPYSDAGAGNEDGWGSFNQTINSFDGYTHSSDTITFILTNTSGTWASAANVLSANDDGYRAAAHIFVTSSPADAANGAIATGFAAEGVPDGGMTISLLGMAMAGLGVMARRRK